MLAILRSWYARENEGASLVEYGLLVGLIAVVCVTAVGLLGGRINDLFTAIYNALPTGTGT